MWLQIKGRYKKLYEFYKATSLSEGSNGAVFVATMEARNYPFMGTQFHPEKIGRIKKLNADQSLESIKANNYFSQKFVSLAKENSNQFDDDGDYTLQKNVIQNHKLVEYSGSFEKIYVFP